MSKDTKMKRILSFILRLSFVFAISCGETNDASSSVSYLDIPNETDAVPSDTLKIACSAFAGNFNPFYASYESDKNIVDIISYAFWKYILTKHPSNMHIQIIFFIIYIEVFSSS